MNAAQRDEHAREELAMRKKLRGLKGRGSGKRLLPIVLVTFLGLWTINGCGPLSLDGGLDELEEEVNDQIDLILARLYPELDAEARAELKVSLSAGEIHALAEEFDAIREEVEAFSRELFKTAEERAEERQEALSEHNDGYPESLEAVGRSCLYDAQNQTAQVNLSGVFSGKTPVLLQAGQVSVLVDGVEQSGTLSCLSGDDTVDVVFLVDITGSMTSVIDSVRKSVLAFVDAIEASGLEGTLSVASFQDSVGVDVSFQEPAPENDVERSPFFDPVDISDAAAIEEVRDFVTRLQANSGRDAPENVAGAIDFVRNSVIGGSADGPRVIDGKGDPPGTRPFPALKSDRQVFVVLTDVSFHADRMDETNSSMLADFVPRDADAIARTLHETGTVVHVVDPSWVDRNTDPKSSSHADVDSDYWAVQTGGLGEDVTLGYSLVDLELLVVSERTGLLDVVLDAILATSCRYEFSADLSATEDVEVHLEANGEVFTEFVAVTSF